MQVLGQISKIGLLNLVGPWSDRCGPRGKFIFNHPKRIELLNWLKIICNHKAEPTGVKPILDQRLFGEAFLFEKLLTLLYYKLV
jgi:hypothetical protein